MNIRAQGFSLAAATLMAGCASTPLPPEVARVVVAPYSSTDIEIHRPRFMAEGGQLELEVHLQRRGNASDESHMDLVFTDAVGRQLDVFTVDYPVSRPPKSPRPSRPQGFVKFRVPPMPSGTVAVEVRGHDEPHERGADKLIERAPVREDAKR